MTKARGYEGCMRMGMREFLCVDVIFTSLLILHFFPFFPFFFFISLHSSVSAGVGFDSFSFIDLSSMEMNIPPFTAYSRCLSFY